MKKYFLFIALLALSCSKQELAELSNTKQIDFSYYGTEHNTMLLRNAFSDSANSFHLEFTGDSINELALLSYSWEGVMPNTSFPKKKRSWSSRGSNIFDPKTQVILSHKNTIRFNQFTEEVSIQIKVSPLVIDDIDKYKTLSYLDLYSLGSQDNSGE